MGKTTTGLAFRSKKHIDAISTTSVVWGAAVHGVDTGDGWLDVGGGMFLPMKLSGFDVLLEQPKEIVHVDPGLSATNVRVLYDLAGSTLRRVYEAGFINSEDRLVREERERQEAEARSLLEPPLAFESALEAMLYEQEEIRLLAMEEEPASIDAVFAEPEVRAMHWQREMDASPPSTANTLPEPPSTTESMTGNSFKPPRQHSNKRLAVLYGTDADEKLAQRFPIKWSSGSASSSAGPPTAGPSGATSSSARPAAPSLPLGPRPTKSRPPQQGRFSEAGAQPDPRRNRTQALHVNEKHDPNRERRLDQQRLRDKHLKNLQQSREKQRHVGNTEKMLQEYYWRVRDVEVEKQSREVEKTWQQREKQRQAFVERKRAEIAQQSDEQLSVKYGRIFADPYMTYPQQVPPGTAPARMEETRPESELEMQAMWDNEALAVFRASYQDAVGRFITPTPSGDRPSDEEPFPSEYELKQAEAEHFMAEERKRRLAILPKGRVEWESPRNPWRNEITTNTLPPPPIESVVASLLNRAYPENQSYEEDTFPRPPPSAPSVRGRRPQPQTFNALSQWRQMPPTIPQRALVTDR